MDGKQVKILDIKVDSTSTSSVLAKISKKIASGSKFYIVTPNPEIILNAQKDKRLAEILNSADISLPDGNGLRVAEPALRVVHGRNVFNAFLRLARQKGWKVFFLGGTRDANKKAIEKAKSLYGANVIGDSGPRLDNNAEPVSVLDNKVNNDIVSKINTFQPHLLFVAFGAPKQEKWVAKWLPKLNIGGAMVIGGALDYLAGTTALPPSWMEKLELEWLWRLIVEPWRLPRIINAAVVFPLKVWLK